MTYSTKNSRLPDNQDEISIRKLILTLVSFTKKVLSNWYLIAIAALLVGVWQYFKFDKIVETYPARIKMLVGRQGIDKDGKLEMEIFSKLMSTQQILIKIFLQPIDNKPNAAILINHYLDTYFELKPEELNDEIPYGFQFENTVIDSMTIDERLVLQHIISKISTPVSDFSDGFVSVSGDFSLGIITINISSASEELSLILLNKLQEEIETLILGNAVFADQAAYNRISKKTDSLSTSYKALYASLNKYRDRRARLLKTEKPKEREIRYLEKKVHKYEAQADLTKTAYLAALEMLNVTQVDLDKNKLKIQVLDRSFAPLQAYKPNAIRAAVKGGIAGSFIMVILIISIGLFVEIRKELFA